MAEAAEITLRAGIDLSVVLHVVLVREFSGSPLAPSAAKIAADAVECLDKLIQQLGFNELVVVADCDEELPWKLASLERKAERANTQARLAEKTLGGEDEAATAKAFRTVLREPGLPADAAEQVRSLLANRADMTFVRARCQADGELRSLARSRHTVLTISSDSDIPILGAGLLLRWPTPNEKKKTPATEFQLASIPEPPECLRWYQTEESLRRPKFDFFKDLSLDARAMVSVIIGCDVSSNRSGVRGATFKKVSDHWAQHCETQRAAADNDMHDVGGGDNDVSAATLSSTFVTYLVTKFASPTVPSKVLYHQSQAFLYELVWQRPIDGVDIQRDVKFSAPLADPIEDSSEYTCRRPAATCYEGGKPAPASFMSPLLRPLCLSRNSPPTAARRPGEPQLDVFTCQRPFDKPHLAVEFFGHSTCTTCNKKLCRICAGVEDPSVSYACAKCRLDQALGLLNLPDIKLRAPGEKNSALSLLSQHLLESGVDTNALTSFNWLALKHSSKSKLSAILVQFGVANISGKKKIELVALIQQRFDGSMPTLPVDHTENFAASKQAALDLVKAEQLKAEDVRWAIDLPVADKPRSFGEPLFAEATFEELEFLIKLFAGICAKDPGDTGIKNPHNSLNHLTMISARTGRPDVGGDRMVQYALRSAVNFNVRPVTDLHVGIVMCPADSMIEPGEQLLYVKGLTNASMKTDEKGEPISYEFEIWIHPTRGIVKSWCQCPIGCLYCHHGLANLVALELATCVYSSSSAAALIIETYVTKFAGVEHTARLRPYLDTLIREFFPSATVAQVDECLLAGTDRAPNRFLNFGNRVPQIAPQPLADLYQLETPATKLRILKAEGEKDHERNLISEHEALPAHYFKNLNYENINAILTDAAEHGGAFVMQNNSALGRLVLLRARKQALLRGNAPQAQISVLPTAMIARERIKLAEEKGGFQDAARSAVGAGSSLNSAVIPTPRLSTPAKVNTTVTDSIGSPGAANGGKTDAAAMQIALKRSRVEITGKGPVAKSAKSKHHSRSCHFGSCPCSSGDCPRESSQESKWKSTGQSGAKSETIRAKNDALRKRLILALATPGPRRYRLRNLNRLNVCPCHVCDNDGIPVGHAEVELLRPSRYDRDRAKRVEELSAEARAIHDLVEESEAIAKLAADEKAQTEEATNLALAEARKAGTRTRFSNFLDDPVNIQRETGFHSALELVAFYLAICDGNPDIFAEIVPFDGRARVGVQDGRGRPTQLDPLNQFLAYMMHEYAVENSKTNLAKKFRIDSMTMTRIVDTWTVILGQFYDAIGVFLPDADYKLMASQTWQARFSDERHHMWDWSDIRIKGNPRTADTARQVYSGYYGGPVGKMIIGNCPGVWIMVLRTWEGGTGDTHTCEHEILPLQEEHRRAAGAGAMRQCSVVDKGPRIEAAAAAAGGQTVMQPAFKNHTLLKRFAPAPGTASVDVARDRAQNERAVMLLKRFGYIKRGIAPRARFDIVDRVIQNCGMRCNAIFRPLEAVVLEEWAQS